MTLNDTLANALSVILNSERTGKSKCKVKPVSNVLKEILRMMHDSHYIGDFKEVDDGRGGYININLLGRINNCRAIKPRYAVKKDQYEKFEKRYLPAKGFGIMIVSTSKGIVAHSKAKELAIGGKLLAYCY